MTTRRDVEFKSEGTTCRGWLYVASPGERRPTVVLAGGWCYVREIVMPTYAEAFVEAGFNALVFDYRNLGVSDGADRQHLDPWAQVRDYQNAISFLERHDEVDPKRIGAWGISYSGGHVLILAAIDPRVKTIVSQIPVIDGYENMRRVHGTMEHRALWKLILEDRKLRYENRASGSICRMRSPIPTRKCRPGRSRRRWRLSWRSRPPTRRSTRTGARVESVDLLMQYDVGPFVKRIYNTPTMMIVAEGDDLTLWDLEIGAFNQIPTTRKKLHVIPHTTHMKLYSDQAKLKDAASLARDWFVETL